LTASSVVFPPLRPRLQPRLLVLRAFFSSLLGSAPRFPLDVDIPWVRLFSTPLCFRKGRPFPCCISNNRFSAFLCPFTSDHFPLSKPILMIIHPHVNRPSWSTTVADEDPHQDFVRCLFLMRPPFSAPLCYPVFQALILDSSLHSFVFKSEAHYPPHLATPLKERLSSCVKFYHSPPVQKGHNVTTSNPHSVPPIRVVSL